jgi:hypothetical protein
MCEVRGRRRVAAPWKELADFDNGMNSFAFIWPDMLMVS